MSKINECYLKDLYLEQQKTDQEIANLCGLSQSTVWSYRRKYGIRSLQPWERHVCEPTEEQIQFMYGSLLGDSGLSDGRKGKWVGNSLFSVMHGSQQKEYVFWKYQMIGNLCNSRPKPTRNQAWWFKTFQHPFFSDMRKRWYPRGNKRLTKQILSVINDSLALAVWYMDDGSLQKKKPHLATCSFTKPEHNLIVDWLKGFNIESHMGNGKYRNLIIDSPNVFFGMIEIHVRGVQCMRYKLPKE